MDTYPLNPKATALSFLYEIPYRAALGVVSIIDERDAEVLILLWKSGVVFTNPTPLTVQATTILETTHYGLTNETTLPLHNHRQDRAIELGNSSSYTTDWSPRPSELASNLITRQPRQAA